MRPVICFLWIANVLNVDELLNIFTYVCASVLDIIAPMKLKKKHKHKVEPWLNSNTRSQACRRAEGGKRINSKHPMKFFNYISKSGESCQI